MKPKALGVVLAFLALPALAAGGVALARRGGEAPTAVLVAAGDIAKCGSRVTDDATADLLDGVPGTVVTLGDNAYDSGTAAEFENCYGPTWGRHKARTRPAAGNHEYRTPGAAGHFGYFGAAAGDPAKGYYSYEVGAWHVVALNSNCKQAGGCKAGSPQERWLRQDLAAHPTACTLAYWHHPRFSSARYGNDPATDGLWRALSDAGADVVLAAHSHSYERLAPLGPTGEPDAARGIRSFVVGTGGNVLYPFTAPPSAVTEARDDTTHGVLEMTLRPEGYDWRFLPVRGQSFTDAGSGACH